MLRTIESCSGANGGGPRRRPGPEAHALRRICCSNTHRGHRITRVVAKTKGSTNQVHAFAAGEQGLRQAGGRRRNRERTDDRIRDVLRNVLTLQDVGGRRLRAEAVRRGWPGASRQDCTARWADPRQGRVGHRRGRRPRVADDDDEKEFSRRRSGRTPGPSESQASDGVRKSRRSDAESRSTWKGTSTAPSSDRRLQGQGQRIARDCTTLAQDVRASS